jgi:glutaredoxin
MDKNTANKLKKSVIALVIIGLIVGGGYLWYRSETAPSKYDSLAQCLTEKQVKMYGAYWCPHCKNQKKEFANAFKYIDYIECSLPNATGQNRKCNEANIESYPTWEFKDGERLTGEIPLEKLAQKAGCSGKLPK